MYHNIPVFEMHVPVRKWGLACHVTGFDEGLAMVMKDKKSNNVVLCVRLFIIFSD